MNRFSRALMLAAVAVGAAGTAPKSDAQVSINIGAEPICPYGYYDYAPYPCAAYGYYGPEWFSGGLFIGAGPWFHGPEHFHGHVDSRFDVRHGYRGPLPGRGEHPDPARSLGHIDDFRGGEMRDGHGHIGGRR